MAYKQKKLWIAKTSQIHIARCTFCKKDIDISTKGTSVLDSHSKGKKHAAKVKEHSSMSLDCFFQETS